MAEAQTTFLRATPALPGMVAATVGYHATGRRPDVHRGLPSPYLTFILSLDEPITTGHSPEHLASPAAHRNDVLVAGLHTAPAYVDQPAHEAGDQLAMLVTLARRPGAVSAVANEGLASRCSPRRQRRGLLNSPAGGALSPSASFLVRPRARAGP